ncbi:asparaginase-domain-containing protein [Neocallimastix sp. 'constans']
MQPNKRLRLNEEPKNFYNSATVHEQVTMESNEMLPMKTSKVLILYTGGTIGMKMTADHVYEPVPNYFTDLLLTMRQFHDPYHHFDDTVMVNVIVKDEELSTLSESEIAVINNIKTRKKNLKALVTPVSLYGKRTIYTIYEYDELIDSANLVLKDWVKIATDIEINYNLFDSFIILHGTDTMAFSASALSFMLENLGKTVILTGSQVPLSEVRNDAIDNLLGALTIAGHYIIPEVTLFFDQKLFRGNRTKKVDATNFNAFNSPNMKPLVKLGININVSWKDVLRPTEIAKFHVHKRLNQHVALLRLYPGITYSTLKSFLNSSVEGVILESYGAGNAPDKRKDLLQALKEATDQGIIIVNCTQCTKGSVSDIYATGKVLTDAGLISGKDMTTECALAKLSYLLGKNINKEAIKQLIKTNIRGELSDTPKIPRFSKFTNPDDSYIVKIINLIKSENNKNNNINNNNTNDININNINTINHNNIKEEEGNRYIKDNIHSKINKILLPSLYRIAASTGDILGLNELLDGWPALINDADYHGKTALHLTAIQNHFKTSEYLIKMGCIVHTRDLYDHTPLWYAVTNQFNGKKKKELIKLFVNSGAVFASSEMDDVLDLLFRTVKKGDLTMLKYLIKCGINIINSTDGENRTIIHYAAIYKQYPILYYLKNLERKERGERPEKNFYYNYPHHSYALDNVSFNGACLLEEINKKKDEIEKVQKALLHSHEEDKSIRMKHQKFKIEWDKLDRWKKTGLNYLEEAMNDIRGKLVSDTVIANEKEMEKLLEEKEELETVINDIFTFSYIEIE